MKPEAPVEYPETPAWTMFFDGPLYQKYKEFMKEKDFSKILLTSKLKLANSEDPDTQSQPSRHEEWWETDIDVDQEKITSPNIYSSVSDEFYRNLKDDKERIKRRTRAFIFLGILIMAALALGTALVIHFVFIPSDEDPSSNMNISLSENISSTHANLSGISTTKLPVRPKMVFKPKMTDLDNLLDGLITKNTQGNVKKSDKPSKPTSGAGIKTNSTSSTTASTTYSSPTIVAKKTIIVPNTSPHIDVSTSTTASTMTKSMTKISSKQMTELTTKQSIKQLHKHSTIATTKQTTKLPVTSFYDLYDLFGMDDYYYTTTHMPGENSTTESNKDPVSTTKITGTVKTKLPVLSTPEVTNKNRAPATTSYSTSSVSDMPQNITNMEVTTNSNTISTYNHTKTHVLKTSMLKVIQATTPRSKSTIQTKFDDKQTTIGEAIPTTRVTSNNVVMSTKALSSTALPTTTLPSAARKTSVLPTTISATASQSMTQISTLPRTLSTTTLSRTSPSTSLPRTLSTTILSRTSPTTTLPRASSTTIFTRAPSTTTLPRTSPTTLPRTSPTTTLASTTKPSTTALNTTVLLTTLPFTTPSTTSLSTSTTTTLPSTTTVQQTTLPEHYTTAVGTVEYSTISSEQNKTFNIINMKPTTTYAGDIAKINCNVKYAIRWKSLIIREQSNWGPLSVQVFSDGTVMWSRSREPRHDVSYETKSEDGFGTDINLDLIIRNVECTDSKTFLCILDSEVAEREELQRSKLIVVGKPGSQIQLTLGPSIIEDKALRLTATWNAGYPTPWTNISWLAIDVHNNTYNLENYGQYSEYELKEDHRRCETRLKHSFVIFPSMELNDTTVMVTPNMNSIRHFVDKEMAAVLKNVKPGTEKILVIPRNYCKTGKKESRVPHPYTKCNKYIRCLPDDLVVQLCPGGTCFYQGGHECA